MNSENWCKIDTTTSKMCFGSDEDCIMDMTMSVSLNSSSMDSSVDPRDMKSQKSYEQEVSLVKNAKEQDSVEDRTRATHDSEPTPMPDKVRPAIVSSDVNINLSEPETTKSKESLEAELAAKISLVNKALADVEKVRKHFEQEYTAALQTQSMKENVVEKISAEEATIRSASMSDSNTKFHEPKTKPTRPAPRPPMAEKIANLPRHSRHLSRDASMDEYRGILENSKSLSRKGMYHSDNGTVITEMSPQNSASSSTDSPPDYSNETAGERLHRKAMERNARLKKMANKEEKRTLVTPYSAKAGSRLHQKAVERQERLRAIALRNSSRFPAHLLDRSKPIRLKRKKEVDFF